MRDYQCRIFALLIFAFLSNGPAHSQSAPSPIDLDLSSTQASLGAGHLTEAGPVNILVGDTNMEVTGSSMLTPAQRLAVYQVVSTGQQSIVLGTQGNAVGGSFTMGPRFADFVSSLNIPQGVTAIKNFGTSASLDLTGNLTNSGTFYAVSNNAAVSNAIINAANITNTQGALLTSVLPQGGLAGLTNLLPNLSLTLNAVNNIVNAGTISSAGFLNVTAGGSIINALPTGVTGPSPIMQAFANLNFQTTHLINSGILASQAANINIATLNATNLLVNNTGGTFNAAGSINVRDPNFYGNVLTDILGGSINSQETNIFAAGGSADLHVDSMSSVLNVVAKDHHSSVEKGNLTLGNLTMTGDPDFYSKTGDVLLQGTINTAGAPLAIVAAGSILTTNANPLSINTSGGALSMVAGAVFSVNNLANSIEPPTPAGNDFIIITAFKNSGNILLNDVGSISTASATGSGGNITMVAPGSVYVQGPITTSGTNNFCKSGSVTIIAGDNQANTGAVFINSPITTVGNSGATSGSVIVSNYFPSIVPGKSNCVIYSNGGIDLLNGGYFSFNSNAPGQGSITLNSINASNNSTNSGSLFIVGANSDILVNGNIFTDSNGGTPGNVTINGRAVTINGVIDAQQLASIANPPGGTVSISASSTLTSGAISTASAVNGGTVDLLATDMNLASLSATGVVGNGGSISAYAFNNLSVGPVLAFGGFSGGSASLTGSQIQASYVDAKGSGNRGGSIRIESNTAKISGSSGGISLNATGAITGGTIDLCARDTINNFIVGDASGPNGTAGNIVANGNNGQVHMSVCSNLLIVPGNIISALGGTVISDRSCCASGSSSPALVAQTLVAKQDPPSLTLPSTGFSDSTILPTDTLMTNQIIVNPLLNSPFTQNATNNAFIGNPLIGNNGNTLIGNNGNTLTAAQLQNIEDKARLIGMDGGSLLAKIALIGLDGGSLVKLDLADIKELVKLIGQDGGSLIGNSGNTMRVLEIKAKLIGQDGGSLLAMAKLIGLDGGSLVKLNLQTISSLIGNNGNTMTAIEAKAQLIGLDSASLIQQASLIGLDSASIAKMDLPTLANLIGNSGNTLVGNSGNTLVGNNGNTLVGNNGNTLVGNNGNTLVGNNGNTLVGNNGNTLVGNNGNTLAQMGWNTAGMCPSCGGAAFQPRSYSSVASSSATTILFTRGAGIFNPSKPIKVQTSKANVRIGSDAVALLLETEHSLAIFNLHDNHKEDIVVDTGSTIIPLAPGQMLNLSKKSGPFDEVCDGRGITYRRPKKINAGTGLNGYLADFSIPSALASVPPLKRALSSNDPQHQRTIGKVVKTAAIVMQMQARVGPYSDLKTR